MVMLDYVSGFVHTVVFSDESQPFYILRVQDEDSRDDFVLRGPVIGDPPSEGAWRGAGGTWVNDPKYGRQFRISRAPALRGGWDEVSASNALVNQGIGKLTVRKLIMRLGDDFVTALDDEDAIAAIDGFTDFEAVSIHRAWKRVRAFFEAIAEGVRAAAVTCFIHKTRNTHIPRLTRCLARGSRLGASHV